MSEWISVKWKLPEKHDRYLVFEVKEEHSHNLLAFNYPYPCCKVNIAYFDGYGIKGWSWASNEKCRCTPTHWMPLPDLPKELEDD